MLRTATLRPQAAYLSSRHSICRDDIVVIIARRRHLLIVARVFIGQPRIASSVVAPHHSTSDVQSRSLSITHCELRGYCLSSQATRATAHIRTNPAGPQPVTFLPLFVATTATGYIVYLLCPLFSLFEYRRLSSTLCAYIRSFLSLSSPYHIHRRHQLSSSSIRHCPYRRRCVHRQTDTHSL